MADTIRNAKIQLRTDTLENWGTANPRLELGEIAIVVDDANVMMKVGNGLSSFNDLDYVWSKAFETEALTVKSLSQGLKNKSTPTSMATGIYTEASATFGVVHGIEAAIKQGDDYAFVWNGENFPGLDQRYTSHGEGTFSINPVNGLSGVYIGNDNLSQILSETDGNVTFKTWRES